MAALGNGVCYGFYLIITRKLSTSDNPLLTLLLSGLIGTIIISLFMPSVWVNPTSNQWILMALIGLIASVAHLFLILPLKPDNKSVKSGLSEVLSFLVIIR
jgi:drug/metabolite transporter (DMT)-like permease